MRWTNPIPLALAVLLLAGACGEAGADMAGAAATSFGYQNPIFQNTFLITADTVKTSGGSSNTAHPKSPTFNWQATHYKHVIVAVFNEPMNIKDNVIQNTDRMVWMWHSGLKAGKEGLVEWDDGLADPVTDKPAVNLGPGTYYWAVWALDLHGTPALSSIEHSHVVQ